jgi:hypothetical protein
MQFATPDHNAVLLFFHDSEIHIGIGLLGRPFQALAFHIGLSATADQIILLKILQPFNKDFFSFSSSLQHIAPWFAYPSPFM